MLHKIIFLSFILITFSASADGGNDALNFRYSVLSKEDKAIAKRAIDSSHKEQWKYAAEIAKEAKDPIVYKIIKWVEYKEAKKVSPRDLTKFIAINSHFPLQTTFKKRLGIETSKSSKKKEWSRIAERTRDYIEDRKYDKAYSAVRGQDKNFDGAQKADALWLSGWIALRYLNKPNKAVEHFKELHRNVGYPISLARAQYWTGRAYESMNDNRKARFWYSEASRHITTFYGQLAAQKIDNQYDIVLPNYPAPDIYDAKNFILDERVKAARALDELDQPDYSRLFLIKYLGESERSVQDYALVALLGQQTVNYEWAVLAGKKAAQARTLIPEANYPILSYTPPAPEKALVMAITRQESQLNRYAKSPAGAMGMMQLMPATAKEVAKQMGTKYSRSLLYDKNYNMQLGSYYINKRINNFDGSYILSIASYNAGIGNVNKWIKRFGDPRKLKNLDDIVDWTENIPFSETRNYVQRVLETTQIYRARLAGGRYRLSLEEDLRR